jgi:predicted homoserine dehydrogenase-like protein
MGSPISDYVLAPTAPAGVFVVVESDPRHELVFENMGVGSGPYYVLATNYHLCHLEIVKTIRRVLRGDPPLLTNSVKPTVSVAAIAKRALRPGEKIKRAIGSSDLRGTAILLADHPKHVPIGLIADAVIERSVEPGQQLTFDDVCIPHSPAARAWNAIIGEVHESLVP